MSAGEDEFNLPSDFSGVIEQEFFRLSDGINPQEGSFPDSSGPVTKEIKSKSPTTSASQVDSTQKKTQILGKKTDSDSEEGSRGQKRAAAVAPVKSDNPSFQADETAMFGSTDETGEGETGEASSGANCTRSSKKPRLVWTAELHSRFMNAVNHLGVKNAVPKTILQLMNVEGMTRENVASHLQKYRLYLKRCAGLPASARLNNETLTNNAQMYPTYVTPAVVLPSQHMAMAPVMVQQGQPMHHSMVPTYMPASHGVYATDVPPMFSAHHANGSVPSATAMGLPYRNRIDSNPPCYYNPYMTAAPRVVPNYAHSSLDTSPSISQPYYNYTQSAVPSSQPSIREPWEGYSRPIFRSRSDSPGLQLQQPQQQQPQAQESPIYNRVSSLSVPAASSTYTAVSPAYPSTNTNYSGASSSYPATSSGYPTVNSTYSVATSTYPTATSTYPAAEVGSQLRSVSAMGSPVSETVNSSAISNTSQTSNMGLGLGFAADQSVSQSSQQFTWSGDSSLPSYAQPGQVTAWNSEDWSKHKYVDDLHTSSSLKPW